MLYAHVLFDRPRYSVGWYSIAGFVVVASLMHVEVIGGRCRARTTNHF